MKKLLLTLTVMVFFQTYSYSQTVNDIPLKDVDVEYIQIVGTVKMLSSKLNIQIDFGQQNKFWSNKEYQLKDADGKRMEFNSMIDALNFLTKNNFEFVQAFTMTVSNQNVYHYLLRKKK